MALLRSKVLREIVLTAMALLILLSGLYGLFKSKFGSTSGESRAIAWAEALGGSVSYNDKRRRPEESRFATRIDLHETSVIDFSPLVELADLNVAGSWVRDLSALGNLPNLVQLRLDRTKISDLTPLTRLTRLKHVSLVNTSLDDAQIATLQTAVPGCVVVR